MELLCHKMQPIRDRSAIEVDVAARAQMAFARRRNTLSSGQILMLSGAVLATGGVYPTTMELHYCLADLVTYHQEAWMRSWKRGNEERRVLWCASNGMATLVSLEPLGCPTSKRK